MSARAIPLFVSYAHADEALREKLEIHIKPLVRQGFLLPSHDRCILPGADWKGQLDRNIEGAEIILLLITANFMASDYCYDVEMTRAMALHQVRRARVIPIIIRPVDNWRHSPFGQLQSLPLDGRPVLSRPIEDEAWVEVARGIREVAAVLQAQPQPAALLQQTIGVSKASGVAPRPTVVSIAAASPPMTRQPTRPLPLWRIALLGAVTLLACLIALFWPPLSLPTFVGGDGGVVVAVRWIIAPRLTAAARALCDSPEVRCVNTALLLRRAQLLLRIQTSGAAVLATIEQDGVMQITQIGHFPGLHLPASQLPSLSLESPQAVQTARSILNLLHRMYMQDDRQCRDAIPPVDGVGAEFTLVGALLEWRCHGGRFPDLNARARHRELAETLCRGRTLAAPACALASYLAALSLECLPEQEERACLPARITLQTLSELAPDERLRHYSHLELLRRTCSTAAPTTAERLLTLAAQMSQAPPCDRFVLAAVSACVMPRVAPNLRQRLAGLEQQLFLLERDCPDAAVRAVLTERGSAFLRAGEFEMARRTYQLSYKRYGRPEDALPIGEALLLLGQFKAVHKIVEPDHQDSAEDKVHAAFLLWLASDAEIDRQRLNTLYQSLPQGARGVQDAAGILRTWCEKSERLRQVFAILAQAKTEGTECELHQTLFPGRAYQKGCIRR